MSVRHVAAVVVKSTVVFREFTMQRNYVHDTVRLLIVVLIAGSASAGQLEPRAGWNWAIAPVRLADHGWPQDEAIIDGGFLKLRVLRPKGPGLGALVGMRPKLKVQITYDIAWTRRSDELEFVTVLFDDQGVRHGFTSTMVWGDDSAYTRESRVSSKDVPIKRITHVGVEVLTPDGRRQTAQTALDEARAAGVEVLPLPVPDEPYAFSLTTRSGEVVTSRGLRGKVVLIDCWATWCQPCMVKMPELKKLYNRYHRSGLEIIGVNFDERLTDMDAAVQKNGLAWPTVHVPNDEKVRDLWHRASSISVLPRLLLVGRDGRLLADVPPHELAKRIDALMQSGE